MFHQMVDQSDRKIILVIGAGAGAGLARILAPKLDPDLYEIIVVEPLPYKAILPATIRMVVTAQENLESTDKAFVPLDKVFLPGHPGRVIQGQVVSVSEPEKGRGSVTLNSGETIPYDILVFATGSHWTGPIAFPWFEGEMAVRKFIKLQREQIAGAKHIVIAGAGAVGIELTGEIKHFFPEKKVTIFHGANGVLNGIYPAKFKRAVVQRLEATNVNVIYNDYIDGQDGPVTHVVTRFGRRIKADLVLSARGPRHNTELLKGTAFSSALTSRDTVAIRPTFQLKGFDNVFAIGDIIEWNEQKQAAKTPKHSQIAANNILALLNNQGRGMKEYKGQFEMILVTYGPRGGASFLSFFWFSFVLGDWFTRMVKSKSVLVPMLRPEWGQK